MENTFVNILAEKLGGIENIKEVFIPGDGEITNINDIRAVLKEYLFNDYYNNSDSILTIDSIYDLLDDFQTDLFNVLTTQWLVTKGVITGTFPKRIAKYFKQKNISLDSKILGKIGDLAKNSANIDTEKYYIDITNDFNWRDGDFGDDGSCFWGGRSGARKLLKENGGYALRYYEKIDDNFRGMGRCWFYPINNENIVIFNQYPSNFKLVKSARILSTLTGYNYQKCYLENNGGSVGLIYINNGSGYVLSKEPMEENSDFDLNIDTKDYKICDNCGEQFEEEEMFYISGVYVCEYCRDDESYICDYCENEFLNYIDESFTTFDDQVLCPRCTRNHTWTCEICNNIFSDNATDHNINGYYICEDCLENHTWECINCGNIFTDRTDMYTVEDYPICEDCFMDHTWVCDNCGEIFLNSTESHIHDGNIYCENCYQNILKEEEE